MSHPALNLCVDCKYFKITKNIDAKYGKCTKFKIPDKKKIEYGYAINTYDYLCHSDYFEYKTKINNSQE